MLKSRFAKWSVSTFALLTIALTAFGLPQSLLVQRVNISKQTFGPCKFNNAAASNDSVGAVGGTISVTCTGLSTPAAPAGVNAFDFSWDEKTLRGSAWIAYGPRKNADGSPKDTISIEGTYNADASTERLISPRIVGMKINNNAVVPSGN